MCLHVEILQEGWMSSLVAHCHDRCIVADGERPALAHLVFHLVDHSVYVLSDQAGCAIYDSGLQHTLQI